MPSVFCPACACGPCECKHKQQPRKDNRRRGSARDRGYDGWWDRASKRFLQQPGNQLCKYCGEVSECTDHVVPHGGDIQLVRMVLNWQPLCGTCNHLKYVTGEDQRNRDRYLALRAEGKSKIESVNLVALENLRDSQR